MVLFAALALLPQAPEVVDYIRQRAAPIQATLPDDLDRSLGECQIAGWGEATHGTREFYALKAAVFRQAVQRHDYRVLALEVDFASGAAIDRFITVGEGDARALVARLGFPFGEEELLKTVLWMREQNLSRPPEKRLRFLGFDMQAPNVALEATLKSLPPGEAARFEKSLLPIFKGKSVLDALRELTPKDRTAALKEAKALVDAVKRSGADAVGVRMAEVFRQGAEMAAAEADRFSSLGFATELRLRRRLADDVALLLKHKDLPAGAETVLPEFTENVGLEAQAKYRGLAKEERDKWQALGPALTAWSQAKDGAMQEAAKDINLILKVIEEARIKPEQIPNRRDPAMADNILWAQKTFGGREFVSAHNFHVSWWDVGGDRMGIRLKRALGKKYFVVGFSFGSGQLVAVDPLDFKVKTFDLGLPKAESSDWTFHQTGLAAFWLRLRGLPSGLIGDWFAAPHPKREGGGTWEPKREDEAYLPVPLSKAFDAIVYFDRTNPSVLVSP